MKKVKVLFKSQEHKDDKKSMDNLEPAKTSEENDLKWLEQLQFTLSTKKVEQRGLHGIMNRETHR